MATEINEKIQVGVVFGRDQKMKPVWFVWSGAKRQIKEITFSWKDRQGAADLYCFAVTDGSAVYEISYNDKSLVWTLEKVSVG